MRSRIRSAQRPRPPTSSCRPWRGSAGFDEACRALFAHKQSAFLLQTQAWPDDVQAYLHQLSRPIWPV
ncbi:DUF2239 family protein [Comamonas sp. JC664]|uniref:DUF2239 family protein n=1 Tax=Comamonas sp. JC664 TaxID=2801917 RepID=UPI00360B090F